MIDINNNGSPSQRNSISALINSSKAKPRYSANFRIDKDLWEAFRDETRRREGKDASEVLRSLIQEYLKK